MTEPSGRRVEVSLERLDDDLPILAERLRTELSDGGCVLVIRNTVRRVQETAAFLRHALPDVPVRGPLQIPGARAGRIQRWFGGRSRRG